MYSASCVELVQSLIPLPLPERKSTTKSTTKSTSSNNDCFARFTKEYQKIEKFLAEGRVESRRPKIYLLQRLIDIIHRTFDENSLLTIDNGLSKKMIDEIQSQFYDEFMEIVPFTELPEDLNFTEMVEQLLKCAVSMREIIIEQLNKLKLKKEQIYEKIPLTECLEYINSLPLEDHLYENSILHIYDVDKGETRKMQNRAFVPKENVAAYLQKHVLK
jgi:hypothetical protein